MTGTNKRTCACGCGRAARKNRHYASGHSPGICPICERRMLKGHSFADCPCHDERAVAYYAGRAEARWGSPPRTHATSGWLADAYNRGYQDGLADPARLWPPRGVHHQVLLTAEPIGTRP